MKRLAIISTHPIQYNAPLFQQLAARENIKIKVFYTWSQAVKEVPDIDFGRKIQWDIPLLQGYNYSIVLNTASKPGNKSFWGIRNDNLVAEIEEWQADAILLFGWNFQSHLNVIRYFHRKKVILFRGDSNLIDKEGLVKTIIKNTILTLIYRFVDKALFVGTHNKDYFLHFGFKEAQLTFAPHTIDNSFFREFSNLQQNELLSLKERLGLQSARHVFIFVGKFIEKKNPLLLLEAFISAGFTEDIHLVFVGDGKLKEEIKINTDNFPNIHLLPFQNQSNLPVIYRLGDTLVLPSKGPNETWGLVINEAIACGLAVITSNKVGCAPELVKEGKNGFVFNYESKEALEKVLNLSLGLNKEIVKETNAEIEQVFNVNNLSRVIENEVIG